MLANKTKTIARSSGRVGLLLPSVTVLKATAHPACLKLRKLPVFVHLNGEDPPSGEEVRVVTELALVNKTDGIVIKVALKLFQLSTPDFFGILFLLFLSKSASLDLVCLA